MPQCNLTHGYFRCILLEGTIDIESKDQNNEGHPYIQERLHYSGDVLQTLEFQTTSLPISGKKNADLP